MIRQGYFITSLLLFSAAAFASVSTLSPAETSAAFKAAGFTSKNGQWRSSCGLEDSGATYSPGAIEEARDINGNGHPDAVISEGGTFCYGNTGSGFSIVGQQADSHWRLMASGTGIPTFLKTKGRDGWPDIEVGGPGFCFPVLRWNGKQYKLHGYQYDGKKCHP